MKIVEQAQEAKRAGYMHIASVVKSVYRTTYYHVVSIDDVITAGRWIPADYVSMMPWHGRIGQIHLPPKTILRTHLRYLSLEGLKNE